MLDVEFVYFLNMNQNTTIDIKREDAPIPASQVLNAILPMSVRTNEHTMIAVIILKVFLSSRM